MRLSIFLLPLSKLSFVIFFFNPSQWVKNNHFLPGTVAFLYRPQPHGKPRQEGLLCTPSSPGQTVTKAKKENNDFAS